MDDKINSKMITFPDKDLSLSQKLDALPSMPGVYRFLSVEKKVIYVGKAQNLRSRVSQYFQKSRLSDPRIDAMISKINDIELTVTDNEVEALILEANLIKQFKPRYNVILKDDKSYPYIIVTNETYPRVFVARRKIYNAQYFGPYTDVKSMRSALKTIRDTFFIRSCNYDLTDSSISKNKFKVCLDYHIKKCEGPCEGFVSREHYNTLINQAKEVLKGKINKLVRSLTNEMEILSNNNNYEEAVIIRDRINALKVYSEKQKIVDQSEQDRDIIALAIKNDDACAVIFKVREGKIIGSQHIYLSNIIDKKLDEISESVIEHYYLDQEDIPPELFLSSEITNDNFIKEWLRIKSGHVVEIDVPKNGDKAKLVSLARNNAQFWLDELELTRIKRDNIISHPVNALQRDLRLLKPPRKIECFDISNIHGTDSVASMVVFVDGKPKKREYRKFKIGSVTGSDDYASMQEVIERRYKRIMDESKDLPDLIMVDGGKGQLSSAFEILKKFGLSTIPLLGLAKRLEEVFLTGCNDPVLLPKTSSSLKLLQHIRDEAHRFAINYHRTIRSKRIIETELNKIKGISKIRAEKLLESFGSVQGIRNATEEQLEKVVGNKVAKTIVKYFGKS